MQLAIFGASGRTGRPLTEQALARGHAVCALVRDPARLPIQHERLTVIQGDATDPAAVARTIAGTQAVLSALGQTKGSAADMQTRATHNIITAMREHNVRRLISLTGAGVRAPQDQPKLPDRIAGLLLRLISPQVLKDAEGHAEVIQASGLDWVIVRGPMLTEDPPTGQIKVGWAGVGVGFRISRADLATFMLDQLENDQYLRQMPMVSN